MKMKMEIKHLIVLISIFYFLHGSSSITFTPSYSNDGSLDAASPAFEYLDEISSALDEADGSASAPEFIDEGSSTLDAADDESSAAPEYLDESSLTPIDESSSTTETPDGSSSPSTLDAPDESSSTIPESTDESSSTTETQEGRSSSSTLDAPGESSSTPKSPDESSSNLDTPDGSSSTPDSPNESSSTPDGPDGSSSTPDSPDESSSTPDGPDGSSWTPEGPDESSWFEPYESTPVSPYFGAVDLTPEAPAPSETFSFTLMPGSGNSELEKICKVTELPIQCMSILSQFINDSVHLDPLTVAKVGIQMSTNMSIQAIATATKIQNDPETSAGLKEALSVCIENYESIPDDNESTLQALDRQDADGATIRLSSSLTSMETCLDGNRQMHNHSPMRDMDTELETLIRINLDIVADMVKF